MSNGDRFAELDNRLTALESVVKKIDPALRDMFTVSKLLNERLDNMAATIKAIAELIAAHPPEPIDKKKG